MTRKRKKAAKPSAGRWLSSWPVISAIAAILYSVGANAMYGHDWIIASVLYFLAILLVTIKFITWEETRNLPYKGATISAAAVLAFLLCGFSLWWAYGKREPPKKQSFHFIGENVAFNSKLPSQLIANVYMQNDDDDQEITASSASGLAATTDSESAQAKVIEEIRRMVPDKGEITFSVPAHEARWFTVFGPSLSDEQKSKYLQGGYTFYFAGRILIKNTKPLEFCAFVIGSNPNAIVQCPSARSR